MISILLARQEDSVVMDFDGHAGYAERGSDIVCAGASALAFTLIQRLINMDDVEVEHEEGDGKMHIFAKGARTKEPVDTIATGFRLLADTYPKHIVFFEEEEA